MAVKTRISKATPDRILVAGYNLVDLVGRTSFGEMVYLLMTGSLPKGHEGDLVEAMLVCCAEHSITSPSTHVARAVANCGTNLQSAVAAGISALGENHGGAGEALARAMQEVGAGFTPAPGTDARPNPGAGARPAPTETAVLARAVIESFRQKGLRVPGIGHRLHNPDPRSVRLFELAAEWGLAGQYSRLGMEIARQVSAEAGRVLPLNVDGALACLLSDIGVHWHYAKAVFIIARSAGLSAHVVEEMETGIPFKFIPPQEVEYSGPPERPAPGITG